MASESLDRRILDFMREEDTGDFARLALALFERQFQDLPIYRRHCLETGVAPDSIAGWREIPAVDLSDPNEPIEEQAANFRSAAVLEALRTLYDPGRALLILGTGSEPNSRSALEALANVDSAESFVSRGPRRLDAKSLRSWLGARQRDRKPVQVIATADGYADLTALLERRGLKFRLPPGSTAACLMGVNEDGGRATPSWTEALASSLGLGPELCRRVICSHPQATPLLESAVLPGGVFGLPHWVRATADESGTAAILDLASTGVPARRIESLARYATRDATLRLT